MRSKRWMERGLEISLSVFALDAAIFYYESETPYIAGRNIVLDVASVALPILFFSVLYFGGRRIGALYSAGKPPLPAVSTLARNPLQPKGLMTGEASYTAAVREKMRGIEVADLLASYNHPDSSDTVRQEAAQELARRGLASDDAADWMTPQEQLRVPSALGKGRTAADYLAATRVRTYLLDLSRLLLIAAMVAFLSPLATKQLGLTLPLSILQLSFLIGLIAHDWTRKAAGITVITFYVAMYFGVLRSILPVGLYYLIYTDPEWFLLGVSVLSGVAATLVCRGSRARILLLRPFGQAQMTSALKRVVRKRVGVIGPVFTLSDRHYRPSYSLDLLKIIGSFRHFTAPILRPSLQIAGVWNEGSYRGLAQTLANNIALDFKSAYCGNQAFNIASSDNWWKYCIDLLMHSTDFTVMDISRVSAGSAWEIAQLGRRNVLDRCIFIVQESYSAEALTGMADLLPDGPPPELHVFRQSGEFLDAGKFEAALDLMLAKALAAAPAATR